MRFVKMHGIGNDYVYVDAYTDTAIAERHDLGEIARRISDRHRGVGSDGLILVCRPSDAGDTLGAHVRMRMFNSDGSESEMCGNGVRCVARFAHDRLGMRFMPLKVETGRGVLSISYETVGGKLTSATVDMGEPILNVAQIPVELPRPTFSSRLIDFSADKYIPFGGASSWLADCGLDLRMTCVSMGNPHVVFFCGHVAAVSLHDLGPFIERQPIFPNRVNAHFVQIHSPGEATMRTWERGAGATQACGTGACAVLVAGVLTGRLSRRAILHLPGGDLVIEWDEKTNHVFMTGPAEEVCEGEWRLPSAVEKIVWMHQPDLVTDRLVLRMCRFEDAPRIAELAGAEEVARWTLLIPHPYRVADARAWIATHRRDLERGDAQQFAITLRTPTDGGWPDEVIGMIGLRVQQKHARAELGYWIGMPYWGRGYATEAATAMIRHGFDTLGLRRIYAYHFAGNEASGRVLQKTGMKPEGVQIGHVIKNGVSMDEVLYGTTRE